MIFASDLDQTLIYSERSHGLELSSDYPMSPAEIVEDRVQSYVSDYVQRQLSALDARLRFIPVTTRTMAQYRRIHLFALNIKPQYAITSNGGNILVDGQPDQAWNGQLQRKMLHSSTNWQEVRHIFQEIAAPEWVLGERFCDELFFSYVIQREKMPQPEVQQVSELLQSKGWNVSVQGRKIYVVPGAVNKQDAVAHLREIVQSDTVIASGDSLLDQGMLNEADFAVVPKHGELYREHLKKGSPANYHFTERSGIRASDEIVDYVSLRLLEHQGQQQ